MVAHDRIHEFWSVSMQRSHSPAHKYYLHALTVPRCEVQLCDAQLMKTFNVAVSWWERFTCMCM